VYQKWYSYGNEKKTQTLLKKNLEVNKMLSLSLKCGDYA
jgi:hypothetical protein